MELARLDPFARDHHGLVTRAAAARAGVSRSAWYRAIDTGLITLVHPGVARMHGSPATPEQRIAAAVLATGRRALASHGTAAHLWGIPGPPPRAIDVIVRDRGRSPTVDGAVVHRPRDPRDLTPVLRSNIPTTNILRTLCDLGALEPRRVPGAVGHVITTRMARPDTLFNAVIRHSRQGRAGVPALRNALQAWTIDGKPPDSVLEPAFHRLVRAHGLPAVEFHPHIGPYVPDFLVIGTPVIVECDGWAAHVLNRPRWEHDLVRGNDLTALGYVIVHVTYRQITKAARATAARVREAIRRWSPGTLAAG